MNNHLLISTLISIGATILISMILIRKEYDIRALKIFIVLYIFGQILGYGFGVDILKAVIPSSSYQGIGAAYQVITSTILPLLLAFIIEDIFSIKEELKYGFFIRMMLLILIFIGLLQFSSLPKILDYILLVLAIVLGAIGILRKRQGK